MRKLVIGCLTVFMLGGALNGGAFAQFGTPVIDGSITPAEYGTHVNGQNQETSGGQVWYMTWDATNLYVGLTGASTAEGAVLYLDAGPLAPINGGNGADGTMTGFAYDNTNFSNLQFRADLVVYVKDGYREYRTADGANGWSGPTAGFGAYASSAGTDRELAIPWSAVGGIPRAFTWFGYVTSAGGFVYGQLPAENGSDLIGLAAREERYYGIGATGDGTSTKPFSRNSYVFNRAADAPGFGAISVHDFTINSSGRTITRAAGGGAPWTIAGTLQIADGTIDFGTSTTPASVAGDVTIGGAGTLALSGAAGGDLSVGGNWTRTGGGALVPNAGTVTFSGTGTQTLAGATQFGDLVVNNAGGGLVLTDNLSVTASLTLTDGVVATGADTLSLGAAAVAAQTGGHVNGNVEKAFTAGVQNFVFPVGDAASSSPVALANFDVTTPGTVTARATGGGDHPALTASGIDPAKSVNRYWTLTDGAGLGFTSYDPTFTFVPADLDGGANTASFLVQRYDGALWSGTTTGAQTPTSTAAVGVTSFSDFAVGEVLTFTITASASSGGAIFPAGSVTIAVGTDTTFTFVPDPNHHIDSVVVDGVNQGAIASFPFTAVDSNHVIAAYFSINTHTITASASSGGTITPSGSVTVVAGSDTTFSIVAGTGYHTDSVVVDGVNQGAIASFPFTAVDSNHTIDAYFSIDTFTIVATTVGNGSIAPSGSVVVSYGDNPLFTVTPNPGYHVDSVVVDGVNQGALPSFTFTAVDANHAITAYFSLNVYTITASAVGNGTIAPSGAVTVTHGSDTTFLIAPALNHHIDSVVVDGVNQGAIASFPFTAVDSSHTITAYFSIDTYTITASASSGGTITPAGAVSVAAGTDTTFTITPDPGSHLDSVVVDGVNVGTPSTYPFTAVLTNHSIAAYFSVDSYFILASAVGGGTIAPADTVLVVYGATPAFTITPDTGYHIDSVVVDGVNQGPLTLYTFAPVDSSHTITAYFSVDTFTIIATATGGGAIAPADTVIVPYGASQAFIVTPDTGYHTDSVVVDGINLGILAGYTFPAVDSNHTIAAYFSINHYTITAAVVGSGTITPSGTIVLPFGTDQTFTVAPDTGYHVDSLVVDGVNRGSLTTWTFPGVAANHTITAYISINGYTITATATAGGTITPSGAVNALYGSSVAFAIAPGIGRHIDSVVVDGVNQGVITAYTFVNITANHTIRAWFSIDLFTIIATADTQGTISPSGSIPAAYGSSRTFTITARRGYGVLDVLVDSVSVGPVTSYTFTNITANHRIDVSFKQVNVFLTITPDSILARDPATSKYWKPAKRYRGIPPNWTNLLSEVVYQGGFQPGATESDAAGGMRVGVSYMTWVAPYKWKPVRDSARTMAWLRLTKWDAKKHVGKTYTALQKTLEDRTGQHEGDPRGFDYLGSQDLPGRLMVNQLTLLPPKKHNNVLFAELVALKVNIAASQLDKTPLGFGELLYENDGHLCDGMSIVGISARADTALTRWEETADSVYEQLYDAIYDINRAFLGPIDTVFFNDGGQLVLDGEVDLADVPFLLRDTTVVARRLARTSDLTEGEEDYDDPEFEEGAPVAAKLYQNYPNPFNPSTTVNFRLREPSVVTITVYNLLGQAVTTLVRGEEMDEGYQALEFVADGLASGVYFCRIDATGLDSENLRSVVTNKMLLLK